MKDSISVKYLIHTYIRPASAVETSAVDASGVQWRRAEWNEDTVKWYYCTLRLGVQLVQQCKVL